MPTPSTQGLAASVVIATRGRPLRLRWLLNALLEQDCDPGLFEVVVAHDPSSSDTARVLAKHPLHAQGRLRGVPFPEGNSLAAGRNAAWQAALAAVPQMLVYHAVHAEGLLRAMRSTWRWRDIAWLAKRHPGVRRHMWGWIWWKREHAALSCAMCGLVLARSRPRWALLVVPWVALAAR